MTVTVIVAVCACLALRLIIVLIEEQYSQTFWCLYWARNLDRLWKSSKILSSTSALNKGHVIWKQKRGQSNYLSANHIFIGQTYFRFGITLKALEKAHHTSFNEILGWPNFLAQKNTKLLIVCTTFGPSRVLVLSQCVPSVSPPRQPSR